MLSFDKIHLFADAIHTVKPLAAGNPKGSPSAVTGVSGSGKTTLIPRSLITRCSGKRGKQKLPPHIKLERGYPFVYGFFEKSGDYIASFAEEARRHGVFSVKDIQKLSNKQHHIYTEP